MIIDDIDPTIAEMNLMYVLVTIIQVAGEDGASAISQLLTSRGVTYLEFLIDEGLTIINGIIPGINKPVAL